MATVLGRPDGSMMPMKERDVKEKAEFPGIPESRGTKPWCQREQTEVLGAVGGNQVTRFHKSLSWGEDAGDCSLLPRDQVTHNGCCHPTPEPSVMVFNKWKA